MSQPSQKLMKASLSKMKMFIIDEVSMVSSLNLAYMHLRLVMSGLAQETCSLLVTFSNYNLSMGRLSEKISRKSLSYKLGCTASVNIWRDCVLYDELTINEQQKKDKEFSSMLDCVRCGCPTDETLCSSAASHTGVHLMSFRNLARHLFVYSQREKHAATLPMKCLPSSLLKSMNYSALMNLTRLQAR